MMPDLEPAQNTRHAGKPPMAALMQWLHAELGVVVCRNEEDILAAKEQACCLPTARFRLQHHFDLEADLLMFDPRLGSVGLVQVLRASASAKEIAELTRRHIDHAAYFRHLLASEAAATAEHGAALPPATELVLLVPRDDPQSPGQGHALAAISTVLRETIMSTDLLDGLGVNILSYSETGDPFNESERRRAFAWLLRKTSAWYDQRAVFAGDLEPPRGPVLTGLQTRYFRVGGSRQLNLADNARIHLIHGHNGSGKSSLAEALELGITGRLRRLAGQPDYAAVLRNRHAPAGESAKIILTLANAAPLELTVTATGVEALAPEMNGMALVLDQATMDELTRAGDAQRAATLLGAFFPQDYQVYQGFRAAGAAAEEAFANLPPLLRATFEPAAVEHPERRSAEVAARFAWLEGATVTPDGLADCLPLRPAALELLLPMLGEVRRDLAAWLVAPPPPDTLPAALARIDLALNALRPGAAARLAKLDTAIACLSALADWRADTGRGNDEPYGERINGWLELLVLCDLSDKTLLVAETLTGAERAGWAATAEEAPLVVGGVMPAAGADALRQARAEWVRQRDQAYALVTQPSEAPGAAAPAAARLAALTARQAEALNEVGQWILPQAATGDAGGLGDTIRQAQAERLPLMIGGIQIGQGDWTQQPLAAARRLRDAYEEMLTTDQEQQWYEGERRLAAIRTALETHRQFHAAGKAAKDSLAAQLQQAPEGGSSIAQALTELVYLFTPARWAFEDLRLKLKPGPDGASASQLALTGSDDTPAALRLNAAELYAVALATFLLCARHPHNALRVLVLDDPFQNMDEMTVSAVARGIGRLMRLWPRDDGWRLLILLHRDADIRRFRQDVPCAVYHLPWLSPDLLDAAPLIATDPGQVGDELFDLGKLMKPVTPRPATKRAEPAGVATKRPATPRRRATPRDDPT